MKRSILILAALMASSAPLAASPFIFPSGTNFSGNNNVVTFDAADADHLFFIDHRPLPLESIKAWAPDGSAASPNNTLQGRLRTVFDLKIDQQGTWKVASEQSMITGTFRLDGEERRVGGRPGGPASGAGAPGGPGPQAGDRRPEGAPEAARPLAGAPPEGPRRLPPVPVKDIPANATDVHLTEIISRVETFVTAGEPTTTVFKPAGKGIELEPITHPNAVVAGEAARFRFLIDGKPASGLEITVTPGGDRYRDDPGTRTVKTTSDGVVTITWPSAGMYWVGAESEDNAPSEKRAERRKASYSVTLEVATP